MGAVSEIATKTDPRQLGWSIRGPVVRLREVGTETTHDVTSRPLIFGTHVDCDVVLNDPEGLISRRHARVETHDAVCTITDLDSTNGITVDGKPHRSVELIPGDTIQIGSKRFVAESASSIELFGLLRRFLGWSPSRISEVDHALHVLRDVAHLRASLILRGHGSLIGIARRLHEALLGASQPFVVHDGKESGVDAQNRAYDGTLVLDGEKLPRDIQLVLVSLRLPNVRARLIITANTAEAAAEVATMIRVVGRVTLPPLRDRADELERIIESYARDAAHALGASSPALGPHDIEWVRKDKVETDEDLEMLVLRIVAVRNWGITEAARRLGMSHGALSRYMQRHGIAT